MWFASITISKFSCLFLSLKQYVDILNSSYWIILTLLYLLVLLSCFDCFLSYFRILHICFLILISTPSDISSYSPFIFHHDFYWTVACSYWPTLTQQIFEFSPNFFWLSLLTSTTFIILFSILLACVVYSLLIIGGIEVNPGPITPTQDTYHLQGNQ